MSHPGRIQNGHSRPALLVAPGFTHILLLLKIVGGIRHHEVGIVVEQMIHEIGKKHPVSVREQTRGDQVDDASQLGILLIILPGIVTIGLDSIHLLDGQAEGEEIFRSDSLANFDIRSIQGADRQCSVH